MCDGAQKRASRAGTLFPDMDKESSKMGGIKILGIVGSQRKRSCNRLALRAIQELRAALVGLVVINRTATGIIIREAT